jgi:hypothetical protein
MRRPSGATPIERLEVDFVPIACSLGHAFDGDHDVEERIHA